MQAKHQWMSSLEAARLSLRILLEVIGFQHVSTSLFSPCRSDNPTNTGQTIGWIRGISCLPESNPLVTWKAPKTCGVEAAPKWGLHLLLNNLPVCRPWHDSKWYSGWKQQLTGSFNWSGTRCALGEVALLPRLAFPMQTHQWTNKCSNRKDCFVISRLAKPLQVRMKSTTDQLREYRVPHPRWYFRGLSDGMTHHDPLTISFSKYHEQRVNQWKKATDLRNSFLPCSGCHSLLLKLCNHILLLNVHLPRNRSHDEKWWKLIL